MHFIWICLYTFLLLCAFTKWHPPQWFIEDVCFVRHWIDEKQRSIWNTSNDRNSISQINWNQKKLQSKPHTHFQNINWMKSSMIFVLFFFPSNLTFRNSFTLNISWTSYLNYIEFIFFFMDYSTFQFDMLWFESRSYIHTSNRRFGLIFAKMSADWISQNFHGFSLIILCYLQP